MQIIRFILLWGLAAIGVWVILQALFWLFILPRCADADLLARLQDAIAKAEGRL